jgi:hypothetical protein
LTREELDLVDVPANTLLLDRLLPVEPVATGSNWPHEAALWAALLGLDAASKSDVTSRLKHVAAGHEALVELAGHVDGAIHGVATEIEIKGQYEYSLRRQRITRLVLLIKEQRSIGHVETGVDATTKLTIDIGPLEESAELAEAAEQLAAEVDSAALLLALESPRREFALEHSRDWHVVDDSARLVTLRLVERGDLVAQCSVSMLPKATPGTHTSLAKFQSEIQQALGKNFGQFVQASEGADSLGRAVLRTVAVGKVQELPIQWNYYLVADRQGNQAVLAFSIESDLVERFGAADKQLVAGLRITAPAESAARPSSKR